MVNMIDFLNVCIFLKRNCIKPEIFAHHCERRVERAKRLHVRILTDGFVMIKNRLANNVLDRNN